MLDDADIAIKRRFFVAERVSLPEEDGKWLYDFCHSPKSCKALQTYIKKHADTLYTKKLNNNDMLNFFNEHADLYVKYTDTVVDTEKELLIEAVKCSSVHKGKHGKKDTEVSWYVDMKDWYQRFKERNPTVKWTFETFKSLVDKRFGYEYDKVHYDESGKSLKTGYRLKESELVGEIEEWKKNVVKGIDFDDEE